MTAIVSIVKSSKCPACKVCYPIFRKVANRFPTVDVHILDGDDPYVKRFQERNLRKSVDSLPDEEMRQYYISQSMHELVGLPTIFIQSSNAPMQIPDMLIGCVGKSANYDSKKSMMKDIEKLFMKAMEFDSSNNICNIGKSRMRPDALTIY